MKKLLFILIMLLNNYKTVGQSKHFEIQVSQNEWEIVNDNVMGGVSIGDFKIQNNRLIFLENYHQNLMEDLLQLELVKESN